MRHQRIAPNNHMGSTHPEANKWLMEFMVDIKKMYLLKDKYPNYQPFTMKRLNEWSQVHTKNINGCLAWKSDMTKRISNGPIPEHIGAVAVITGLVIDLKLLINNQKVREITPERIKEADSAYLEITRCRKRRMIYY